ncbi:hypothetical protein MHY29_00475 [Micrococcus sp. ACRRV]|uniref:hypothetical protein n=1 Tax=Micrococcus sp. ACRRV TaxID=2918203 RepID=UPI001EF169AA|nr:hypothetical protein [Micrococcus sp. ACRRV]MCG7421331.1 hypothetical protein [Micrococcus sp. ACRRV]
MARLRAMLERVRVGADSAVVSLARLALVDAGLGEPLLQHRLDPWDPDCPETHMFSPELAVALEYDGGGHLTPAQQARDARRDRRLPARGVTPLRNTAEGYRRLIAQLQDRRRGR